LEDRLQRLEALWNTFGGSDGFSFIAERNLFNTIQTPEAFINPKKSSDIPSNIKQQLLETYREDLISLSFKVINHKYLFLPEKYLLDSAVKSPMVLHSMHALGSLIATPSQLPSGVNNRAEMALIYFEKSLTFFPPVISNPHEQGVLALFLLAAAAMKMDRG
jgi:hypothetical protein